MQLYSISAFLSQSVITRTQMQSPGEWDAPPLEEISPAIDVVPLLPYFLISDYFFWEGGKKGLPRKTMFKLRLEGKQYKRAHWGHPRLRDRMCLFKKKKGSHNRKGTGLITRDNYKDPTTCTAVWRSLIKAWSPCQWACCCSTGSSSRSARLEGAHC